jgi:hypothetical protein
MDRRLQLQALLEELIGSSNVYFQPPETVKLLYPCIVYRRSVVGKTEYANDKPYHNQVAYDIIVIDKNPDSALLEKVASLPMCRYDRHFTKDNLNHDTYKLYY